MAKERQMIGNEKTPERQASPDFIVGIGASAGGLEAIEALFEGISDSLGMAYIIVQHLSPDFRSLMDELLARKTSMPILQAADGMALQPDHLYLMPPKKELAVSDSKLILKDRDASEGLTFPIDYFLRSLAQDAQERAIGIILSGTGSDGSRGICDIHDAGGLVIVQNEESARFNGMPRSAEDSGIADLVLPPERMKEALAKYRKIPRPAAIEGAATPPELNGGGLKKIYAIIREAFGLNLESYKSNTIVRRTERRIVLSKLDNIDDYANLVASDSQELSSLYSDLLIGVTRFFRDMEAFESLRSALQQVVGNASGNEIRIWIAGCSTGQEAYSIGILILETLADLNSKATLKVFATDIDPQSLEVAQLGTYRAEELRDVPENLRYKYFAAVGHEFRAIPELRQAIVFAQHNILRDAPFTRVDMVVCRNLLIYMQPKTQRKILTLFHFGLKAQGVLFLGPSENPVAVAAEFDAIDERWRIFKKRRDARLATTIQRDRPLIKQTNTANQLHVPQSDGLLLSVYDAMLSKVMPPSFLVTQEGHLVHTFGDAGIYLRPEEGRATSQLSERILPELRAAVTAGLKRSTQNQQETLLREIRADLDGAPVSMTIGIRPFSDNLENRNYALIQIQCDEWNTSKEEVVEAPAELAAEHLSALEAELKIVKQTLQATIQELETSNEELQATNEEMLASNEELQSTNEELHSVNEELYTVNAEYQNKIAELSEVTRDMDNLLLCTEVHTVFLDRELKVRKITPRIGEAFNIIPQDIGRRIDSFTNSIECDDLTEKLQQVIETGESLEEEVCDKAGVWFLMRLLPYRSVAGKPADSMAEGALLTLVNISKLRETTLALQDSIAKRDQFLAMLSHELRNPLSTIVAANGVMAKHDLEQSAQESMAIIRRQSSHMATLLDDLLDVTRVSQGKIHLQRRPFNVKDAIAAALESVRPRCAAREQPIETILCDQTVWINGSEPRIMQVISNLLTNASKYSPPGETIELSLTAEAGMASVSVRDNGVGIRKDHVAGIFELFAQSDHTIDRADGGLGIGLTLVQSLVELHDGTVSVYSAGEGCGSKFTVSISTCEPQTNADHVPKPHMLPSQTTRVVLVEDNIDATKMLAFLLEDAGYHVSIANDGIRGLQMIKSLRPETAIIDIGLPGISGYEIAQKIRADADTREMFLIALTGYGQATDREEALASGFDEHIVKPVAPDLLDHFLKNRHRSSEMTTE
ncbi:MAG: chemotaxis protein CheB [Planctomycetota bacterium]